MRRAPLFLRIAAAAMTAMAAAPAWAQYGIPEKEFTDSFKANHTLFCDGSAVRLSAMLGELAKNFGLNPFALPPIAGIEQVEARTVAWILASATIDSETQAMESGLTPEQFRSLNAIRFGLAGYLVWLQANPEAQIFTVDPATQVTTPGSVEAADALVAGLFAPLTGTTSAAPVRLACRAPAAPAPAEPTKSKMTIAVRGKIDDLAIPRFEPGGEAVSKSFEKAAQANLAFTDNKEKGETSVAIEAAFGVGQQLGSRDAIFGFAHYVQSTTETDAAADDDDSKDVRALSAGLLYRRTLFGRGLFAGSLGLTVYPTFDFAQNAKTARGRLFLSDIAIDTGRQPLCDSERKLGPLGFNCRLGLFVEAATIFDAGRSIDLAAADDDQYLGGGGEIGLSFWLPDVEPFAPLMLTADYRYMAILAGKLDDPHRLSISLSYLVPKSNISLSLSHVEGANFETFQRENLNKLSIGFKY